MSSSVFAWNMCITRFCKSCLNRNRRRGCARLPFELITTGNLCCERRSAPATSGRVRILESEAGTHDTGHVVDLDAIQVLSAEHVDKHADTFFVEHEIAFTRLLFDVQAVLKARAPSGYNSHAEPGSFG